MNDRKHHGIASFRWMGYGVMLLGLMGGLGGMGLGTGAAAPVMRVSQQQIAEAETSAGNVALDEGMRLYKQQTAESLRQAIIKFEEAMQLFRVDKDRTGEALTLLGTGRVYGVLGESQKALESYSKALPLFRAEKRFSGEAFTLNEIGLEYDALGERRKALVYLNQALPLSRAFGERTLEAMALNYIGAVYNGLGEKQKALAYYNQALPLIRAVGDRRGLAITLLGIGRVFADLEEKQKALENYNQALIMSRSAGEHRVEAFTLNNIGGVYDALGEKQKAMEYYNQVLSLLRVVGDRRSEATVLNNIGKVYDDLGEKQKALDFYSQSLSQRLATGDRSGEATSLNNMGYVYDDLGEKQKALDFYNQALLLSQTVGDRSREAGIFNNIGKVYDDLGEKQKALDFYNQALLLSQTVGDRSREAVTLHNVAYTYRAQGKLASALEQINKAIVIIEDLRTKIDSKDLRATYFSTVQDIYQFKTDLLMQLHQKSPKKGYDKQAFETSDRSRARSLIELLTESGIDLKPKSDLTLFEQERKLNQILRDKENQRVILLSKNHTSEQSKALDKESEALLQDLETLKVQIRVTNPAYADIKYPQPLTLSQVREQVLDKDTLLLQYSLGEKQSYLWAVSVNGIQTYILPKRSVIEDASTLFRNGISTAKIPIAEVKSTGDSLYQIILSPVANQLSGKRLLIVADGALQTIPFAALPLPNSATYNPLLKEHEIINAPSAASVAVLRQQAHLIGPKTLAILADPIFRNDDPRIGTPNASALETCVAEQAITVKSNTRSLQNLPVELQSTLRGFNEQEIQRLPSTRLEAERILALVLPEQRSASCAFAANYERVMQPRKDPLDQYQIVHFATHGFVNENKPQFSGLLLSLFDSQRKPQDGFLRLYDIFNLRLAADLVVLSACETGLGKDIRGEGLVGLTRGFIYAGSRRVVTSLWQVTDETTGILMADFYQEMLQQKQTPPAALRAAQLKMWSTKPDPYLWAAFTLQGEWRP